MHRTKRDYAEFLQTQFWKDLSSKKKQQAGWKCQQCGDAKSILESHHLWYRESWFDTQLEDLVCVCPKCHATYHPEKHGIKRDRPERRNISTEQTYPKLSKQQRKFLRKERKKKARIERIEAKKRMPSIEQRKAEAFALSEKWRGMTKNPNQQSKTFVRY